MFYILVVWKNGSQEYLKEGDHIASFGSMEKADSVKEFMLEGISEDVQSINVVQANHSSSK